MKSLKQSTIPVAAALTAALALLVAGVDSGPALIAGAVVGIVVSLVTQRRRYATGAFGGSEEPGDIDAACATARQSIESMPAQVAQIEDVETRHLAARVVGAFRDIMASIDTSERNGVAPLIVDQLIEPAQALLTDYLWLQKRPETTARDGMTRIALKDLPAAEHSARQVIAVLERPGSIDVAALRRAVDFQFSFGGETAVVTEEMWGDRDAVVKSAERSQ
ncbi:MAG: hypothetical protein KF883_13015 [Thermomicrobiales bacterium]|nr:hypothetical protein [Thermomicrobiales bacterium]